MNRSVWLTLLLALALVAAVPVFAGDDDTDEYAVPQILCVSFTRSGDAASAKLEDAFLTKMREAYATKNVLFVNADLTSPATTHQARLLLNSIGGCQEIWEQRSKMVGKVVLIDLEWGAIRATLDSKTTADAAKKAFEAAMKPMAEEDGDEKDG